MGRAQCGYGGRGGGDAKFGAATYKDFCARVELMFPLWKTFSAFAPRIKHGTCNLQCFFNFFIVGFQVFKANRPVLQVGSGNFTFQSAPDKVLRMSPHLDHRIMNGASTNTSAG